ncbi:FAD binding domain-containing protein [Methylobacterium radiotolerans]|uniref:FAD binding domain-containing protein n=1 Tax=Methylobacterium radiotolerans TaxID=31998 RepID=UPI000D5D2413|nr:MULTISPECIES: FAD binding domain-containing protein [Methylobacterium]MDE3746731.1 FAD binding domain-containing protein [Methylobacterium radiotolerans]PVY95971.1 carbon-monoxide dehydrogenase medium subunit [Methylobacterium organophilum]
MKPAAFAWERPDSLPALLARLAEAPAGVKLIAGGQSLGPMLNLRLVEPVLILDITGVPELRTARVEGDTLVLGACVTHADIEDGRVPDLTGGALRRVAAAIAYRPVRNRGTIGGSLVHADPAADWVSALTALGAEVEIAGRNGRRTLPVERFVTGALAVALGADEILVAVRVPALPAGAAWGYVKHCAKIGEFAHAIGAVHLEPGAGRGRAVIGAVEGPPVLLADARPLFGGRIGPDFAARFDPRAADQALRDAGMADAVERHIHVTVLGRAVAAAAEPDPRSNTLPEAA